MYIVAITTDAERSERERLEGLLIGALRVIGVKGPIGVLRGVHPERLQESSHQGEEIASGKGWVLFWDTPRDSSEPRPPAVRRAALLATGTDPE